MHMLTKLCTCAGSEIYDKVQESNGILPVEFRKNSWILTAYNFVW